MGCVAVDTMQDSIGLLSSMVHFAHVPLTVCHGPLDLSSRAAATPVHTHCASLPDIFPSQGLDFSVVLIEFHKFTVSLFLQTVQIVLDGSPAFKYIAWSPHFGVICSSDECLMSLPPGY